LNRSSRIEIASSAALNKPNSILVNCRNKCPLSTPLHGDLATYIMHNFYVEIGCDYL
jgi:hypothetical protein